MSQEGFLKLFYMLNKKDFEVAVGAFFREHPGGVFEEDFKGDLEFARNSEGRTLLHEAAFHGSLAVMEYILSILERSKRAKENIAIYIEAKDYLGWTPLFSAVAGGHWSAVKFLQDLGARADVSLELLPHMLRNDDWISSLILIPPASSVAANGPFSKLNDTMSKFPWNIVKGNPSCKTYKILWVLRFLGYLPDINLALKLEKDEREYRLIRDLELFRGQVNEFLEGREIPQDLKARVEDFLFYIIPIMPRIEFLKLFDFDEGEAERKNFERQSTQFLASSKPYYILSRGANDWTLMHAVAFYNCFSIVQPIMKKQKELVGAGSRLIPNIMESKDSFGRTPLFVAVDEGNWEVALFLISEGANKLDKDINNRNLLHYLVELEQRSPTAWLIVFLLIPRASLAQSFPEINQPDNKGRFPLSDIFLAEFKISKILFVLEFLGYDTTPLPFRTEALEQLKQQTQKLMLRILELFRGQVHSFLDHELLTAFKEQLKCFLAHIDKRLHMIEGLKPIDFESPRDSQSSESGADGSGTSKLPVPHRLTFAAGAGSIFKPGKPVNPFKLDQEDDDEGEDFKGCRGMHLQCPGKLKPALFS